MGRSVTTDIENAHLPATGVAQRHIDKSYLRTVELFGEVVGAHLYATHKARADIGRHRQLHATLHAHGDVGQTGQLQAFQRFSAQIGKSRQLHSLHAVGAVDKQGTLQTLHQSVRAGADQTDVRAPQRVGIGKNAHVDRPCPGRIGIVVPHAHGNIHRPKCRRRLCSQRQQGQRHECHQQDKPPHGHTGVRPQQPIELLHGLGHLMFHGALRYIQLCRNLFIAHAVALAHEKHLTTPLGQSVDGFPQPRLLLRTTAGLIVTDEAFQVVWCHVYRVETGPPQVVDTPIAHGGVQKRTGITGRMLPQTDETLLHDILRRIVSPHIMQGIKTERPIMTGK